MLRASLIVLAAVGAVLILALFVLLPPAAVSSTEPTWKYSWPVVRGAYHIHSSRSDGTGSIDDIAAAAARAGLQFVIVTDHGDGTRPPDAPVYRSGVLCIDAVEVSSRNGHYVALAMPQTEYRLAGDAGDVVEDVARLGGFGVAAHPTSAKDQLRWEDWNAPFDGIEWLNADSEWRDEPVPALTRALLTYPLRPAEALATLLDRPVEALQYWDRTARTRHVVGLAAADAHARLSLEQSGGEYDDAAVARLPSYEASFRVFVNHVVLDGPLTGDAAFDARSLMASIRAGRVFTAVEGIARLGAFEFKAESARTFARTGEYIDSPHPVELSAVIAAPRGTTMTLLRDGVPIYDATADQFRVDVGTLPAIYRVEARLPQNLQSQSIPWVVSNPIYVNLRSAHTAVKPTPVEPATARTAIATQSWHAEAAAGSESVLSAGKLADGTPTLDWRLKLAAGPPVSQFAAIWFPADRAVARHDRLQLRARADRPMRIWAQLRGPGRNGREQRWAKSFYLGPEPAMINLELAAFRTIDPPSGEPPPMDKMDSLLLVADTLHTLPGTSATISIADLWLVK